MHPQQQQQQLLQQQQQQRQLLMQQQQQQQQSPAAQSQQQGQQTPNRPNLGPNSFGGAQISTPTPLMSLPPRLSNSN